MDITKYIKYQVVERKPKPNEPPRAPPKKAQTLRSVKKQKRSTSKGSQNQSLSQDPNEKTKTPKKRAPRTKKEKNPEEKQTPTKKKTPRRKLKDQEEDKEQRPKSGKKPTQSKKRQFSKVQKEENEGENVKEPRKRRKLKKQAQEQTQEEDKQIEIPSPMMTRRKSQIAEENESSLPPKPRSRGQTPKKITPAKPTPKKQTPNKQTPKKTPAKKEAIAPSDYFEQFAQTFKPSTQKSAKKKLFKEEEKKEETKEEKSKENIISKKQFKEDKKKEKLQPSQEEIKKETKIIKKKSIKMKEKKKMSDEEVIPPTTKKEELIKMEAKQEENDSSLTEELKEQGIQKMEDDVISNHTSDTEEMQDIPEIKKKAKLLEAKKPARTLPAMFQPKSTLPSSKSPKPKDEAKPKMASKFPKSTPSPIQFPKKKKNQASSDINLLKGPLDNLTFVITGELESLKRDDLIDLLKNYGGKVTSAVSRKTNYLVIGSALMDNREVTNSAKYKKAESLGTKILNESELEEFLKEKLKKPEFILGKGLDDQIVAMEEVIKKEKKGEKKKEKKEEIPNQLWVDKYAPSSITQLVGNNATIEKLFNWLKDWDDVIIRGNKKKVNVFAGKWQDAQNPNARACLLSGPPGIGKTSAARLVAKTLGYNIVETNASDQRNKKTIENLLKHTSNNQSILFFMGEEKKETDNNAFKNKSVIIMDEVDGVSGSDRGGIQALIQVIKATKLPIICICNDRQSTKVRSLANHCFDLKFMKPNKAAILKRALEIGKAEKMKMESNAVEMLIESTGNDIRQVLNFLQMWKTRTSVIAYSDMKSRINSLNKDDKNMLTNFEAATKLLNSRELERMPFWKKLELFFIDFELLPLLIHENYLNAYGSRNSMDDIERMAQSADYISLGDTINKSI